IRRSSKSGSRFSRPRAIVFASSLISVEKNSAGPGVIEAPKKLDRCGVKHEIVALILTAIRASVRKRRKPQLLYTDSCNRLIVNGLERELPTACSVLRHWLHSKGSSASALSAIAARPFFVRLQIISHLDTHQLLS